MSEGDVSEGGREAVGMRKKTVGVMRSCGAEEDIMGRREKLWG